MSKTSKSRLTGSGKKRRDAAALAVMECRDGLGDCHVRLAALAGLMVSCSEAVEAYQLRGLGVLLTEEVCRLGELKDLLDEEAR